MASFGKRLRGILDAALIPAIELAGFNRSASSYIAQKRDLAWVIEAQKSRWNDKDTLSFTINSGIYVPEVIAGFMGINEPERRSIEFACIHARIGLLDPTSRLDRWWELKVEDGGEVDCRPRPPLLEEST